MKRFWAIFFAALALDFYVFPVGFTFLPGSLNSKMIMAGFGLLAFLYRCVRHHSVDVPRYIFISGLLAICFSLWCLYSITAAGTHDMVYVLYIKSFFTWLFGAFGACVVMRQCLGKADLPTLTHLLTLVCVAQCILAILIDNVGIVNSFVNRIFLTGHDYYEGGNRLYGIGCALDVAGVRFSAILLLIAHQIVRNPDIGNQSRAITTYLTGFLIITIVGSMISRTTGVGAGLGLAYMAIANSNIQRGGFVASRQIRIFLISFLVIFVVSMVSVYLYNSNAFFYENLRFGFEGFFNWVETGNFHTGSTDHLKTMWVWPTTQRGWIIGEGIVGVLVINSDIGYCNYIFYCGLIGLTIFSIFFIYNHLCINGKFKGVLLLSLLLVALTFIIWCKVQTDIFFINALLFCIAGDVGERQAIPSEPDAS